MQKNDPLKWRVGTSYSLSSPISLDEVKEAGLDGIELVISRNETDLTYQEVKRAYSPTIQHAQALDLDVWSIHLPFGKDWDISTLVARKRQQIIDYHVDWLKCVSEWKVKHAVLHPSYEPIAAEERSERVRACKSSLNQLVEVAEDSGIHLCVENLPRTCLGNTGKEITALTEENQHLRVCCDVNHLLFELPEQFIEEVGSTIQTVHISDYDGEDEKHWLPGKGIIQWKEVIHALANSGYEGFFMFEVKKGENIPAELAACWKRLIQDYQAIE